jgi:hypothetical protein
MSKHVVVKWKDIRPEMQKKGINGIGLAAEYVLGEANRIVPHDEGHLQGSGKTSVDPRNTQAAVSYNTPYAVRLHENPQYRFQKGRQGKWLERTITNGSVRNQARSILRNALRV